MSSSSLSCGVANFSLSSGGGLGGLFRDACSLSSGGGLGGLFCDACTLSSGDSSENGSIFNSNVSSSSTILHLLELDSSSCVLCNALLLCTRFSASCLLKAANSHCLGETGTSPGGCLLWLDFETSSVFCTYKTSTYSSLNKVGCRQRCNRNYEETPWALGWTRHDADVSLSIRFNLASYYMVVFSIPLSVGSGGPMIVAQTTFCMWSTVFCHHGKETLMYRLKTHTSWWEWSRLAIRVIQIKQELVH